MAKRQEVPGRTPVGSTAAQLHTPAEAVDLVKSLATAKFDETVELAVPPRASTPARPTRWCGAPSALPSGTGK